MISKYFMDNSSKMTIGYICHNIENNVGWEFRTGIIEYAKKLNVNVIIYTGSRIGESIQNLAYELVDKDKIQGALCWLSYSNENDLSYFFKRFGNLPVLILTLKIKDYPYVGINSYKGMKDLVTHLVVDHNYKKIAIIKGENRPQFNERYDAYFDVLKEYSIPINDNLITLSEKLLPDDGEKSVKIYLDERKLKLKKDIEAIVSISDTLAISAYKELKKRNIKIPEEIALTGFNNYTDGDAIYPPITSVKMPFRNQAELALTNLVDIIKGKNIDKDVALSSELAIKESCGCNSNNLLFASVNKEEKNISKNKANFNIFSSNIIIEKIIKPDFDNKNKKNNIIENDKIKKVIIDAINQNIFLHDINMSKDKNERMILELIDSMIIDINENNKKIFINKFKEILISINERNGNILLWQQIISIIREKFILFSVKDKDNLMIENIFNEARILISEFLNISNTSLNLSQNKESVLIQNFCSEIVTIVALNDLKKLLNKWLPKFEISNFYLSIYENPSNFIFSKTDSPEFIKLIYCYENNYEKQIKNEGLVYKSRELIPNEFFDKSNDFYNLIVEPLTFKDKVLGFFIIKNGPAINNLFEVLKNVISSCIQTTYIMQEMQKNEDFLENKNIDLKHKTQIISNSSEKISEKVNDISVAMEEVAINSQEVAKRIKDVMDTVYKSVLMAKNATNIIESLKISSEKVGKITEIITDIAQKTNILSLNANIEAARSGNYGKGFKIVAKEIKVLSQETVLQADVINKTIALILNSTGESFNAINNMIEIINQISGLSNIINEAVSQQAIASNDISKKLLDAASESKEINNAIKLVSLE